MRFDFDRSIKSSQEKNLEIYLQGSERLRTEYVQKTMNVDDLLLLPIRKNGRKDLLLMYCKYQYVE